MITLLFVWLCFLYEHKVDATDPPACNSSTFANFEVASGYCMFFNSSMPKAPNRTSAQAMCRHAQPTAQLASVETGAKFTAARNLVGAVPDELFHLNMKQNQGINPSDQGWKHLVENELLVVPIAPIFFSLNSLMDGGGSENFGYIHRNTTGAFLAVTLLTDDNDKEAYVLCQFKIPDPNQNQLQQEGFVEEMAKQLAYDCQAELNGVPMGSSCFYVWPFNGLPLNNDLCAAEAEQHETDRQAHLYTKEIMTAVLGPLNDPFYWIGLQTNTSSNETYWIDEETGQVEHGYRQTDRPDLPGMGIPNPSACSVVDQVNTQINDGSASDCQMNSHPCLMERKIPGERYHLEHNTHYQPNAPILNTIEGESADPRQCAFRCLMQRGCLAFNLRADNNTCQLLPVKISTTADGGVVTTMANGWDYYERIDHNVFG